MKVKCTFEIEETAKEQLKEISDKLSLPQHVIIEDLIDKFYKSLER